MRNPLRRPLVAACFLLVLGSVACGEEESDPVSTVPPSYLGLELVSGDGQVAPPGEPLTRLLVVRVRADGPGTTRVGNRIVWVVESGGGVLTADTLWSDEGGESRNQWRLGPHEGSQSVRAYLTARPSGGVTFTAVADEGEDAGG